MSQDRDKHVRQLAFLEEKLLSLFLTDKRFTWNFFKNSNQYLLQADAYIKHTSYYNFLTELFHEKPQTNSDTPTHKQNISGANRYSANLQSTFVSIGCPLLMTWQNTFRS